MFLQCYFYCVVYFALFVHNTCKQYFIQINKYEITRITYKIEYDRESSENTFTFIKTLKKNNNKTDI